ncbi:MAG TPA: TIGR00730 family Rossman fold protein, partial [Acinetobacter sp.]|nr:TIGR00730 family Rossman fold protein [Acinetobacter sp.]
MNSVLSMSEIKTNNLPKTTQTLIALYCGSRSGNNPIY